MKQEKITTLLSLLALTLFALSLLLVLLFGTRAYRQTLEETEIASDKRTKLQYLSTRIRQSQDIAIEDFGGQEALTLREEIDGECYVTYIYCWEGWLREVLCAPGAALTPGDGERLLEAQALQLSAEEGLLTIRIDGSTLLFARRAMPADNGGTGGWAIDQHLWVGSPIRNNEKIRM